MIHVFHGFLGSPLDFSFLPREDVTHYDLYQMTSLPVVAEDDTLIGYSMGGRVALEIANAQSFKIKRLVLINSHPGLSSIEEKKEREIFENKVQEKLEELSLDKFLLWWNELPVFEGDAPISTSLERFEKSPELFEKYRLSKQKNYLPDMGEHKEKFLYLAGREDKKYFDLAKNVLAPLGIKIIILSGGHRLFQKDQEILKVLKEEGIL